MTKFTGKLNNRGFSLVELLVAVAIMVIVMGPLLGAFVHSQRMSRKSHELGEATLVSRNIVETIKMRGVANIAAGAQKDFDDGTALTFGGNVGAPVLVTNVDGGTDRYTYTVTDIPAGTFASTDAGGTPSPMLLDAVITIDATKYRRDDPSLPPIDPSYEVPEPWHFNELEITEYVPLDGLFSQPRGTSDPDEIAIASFESDGVLLSVLPNPGDAHNYVIENIRRTITVDVIMSAGADDIAVVVNYSYQLLHPSLATPLTENIDYHEVYWGSYDKDDPSPLSLYIFYRPYYPYPAQYGTDYDEIIINNVGATVGSDLFVPELTVFLVKQKPVNWETDTEFTQKEAFYRSRITQIENEDVFGMGSPPFDTNTTVYSNYNLVFSSLSTLPNAPVPVSLPDFTRRIKFGAWNVFYTFSLDTDELVSKTTRDRMFDINVEVYSNGGIGTTDPLITFDATHLD